MSNKVLWGIVIAQAVFLCLFYLQFRKTAGIQGRSLIDEIFYQESVNDNFDERLRLLEAEVFGL